MFRSLLRVVCLILTFSHAQAAEENTGALPCARVIDRPCVGLVLGGGGARGGAHVGVLQVLEEQGIPIDVVVGTSIGAFVGGLYASGRSAEEISQLFEEADWNRGYQDNQGREGMRNRRKRQYDSFPIRVDLGLDADGFSMPRGFIQGQGMKTMVDGMLGYFPRFTSFDELSIPFRAVAADIVTGEAVVLQEGDLATALQTSMSLPGILRPVERDGRLLVDGGIANNLPVDVAQQMGAEILIVVDIGSDLMSQAQLSSSVNILRQLTGLLTRENAAYQKSLLRPDDTLIQPNLENITLLSFERMQEAIEAGRSAATSALAASEILTSIRGANTQRSASLSNQGSERIEIAQVNLQNRTRLADDYLLSRLGLQTGREYSPGEIQSGIDRLYGQGTIARVYTSVDTTGSVNILDVEVDEKEWGPGYLDFKFSVEDDYDSFSRYQLGASYRYTNISPYGAEWYSSAEIGTNKRVYSELYWPFRNTGFYGELSGGYTKQEYAFLVDGASVGEVLANGTRSLAGVGFNVSDQFDFLIGTSYEDGNVEVPELLALATGIDEVAFHSKGVIFRTNFDSLDNATFPTRGWKLLADVTRQKDRFLNISGYSTRVDAELTGVVSRGRHNLRGLLRYQRFLNEDPLDVLGTFQLGGFLNLSGMTRDAISGQHVRFASAVYTYELIAADFGAISLPLYLGASLEAGNAWNDKDAVDYGNLINAGSLFVGWDSPLGPAYFAYGRNDEGDKGLYLYLGFTF